MFRYLLIILTFVLFGISAHAEDFVEVMGNVSVSQTYAYEKPDFKSKAVAKLVKGSKVLIMSQEGDWMKIVLFNEQYAYVYADYVTLRFENVTRKETEIKAVIDIKNLIDQFNDTVQSSWFAEKQKVVPSMAYLGEKGPDEISLLYTAVNNNGEPVPSLKENPLHKDMVKLLELIYMKMIVLTYDHYRINIMVPDFSSGTYRGRTQEYASLVLQKNFANIDEIKNGTGTIWDYVKSAKKPEELFMEYPH